MEWRCHLRYWRMEQKVFFFDDRILNSIEILRLSRSSVLKCSFVTTQGPSGYTRSFSVLAWIVYTLHELFIPYMNVFLLMFTTWFTLTTLSNAVTLSLFLQITQTRTPNVVCNARFNIKSINFAHTMYLPVSNDSHNKQKLIFYTAFTDWSPYWKHIEFSVRWEQNLHI